MEEIVPEETKVEGDNTGGGDEGGNTGGDEGGDSTGGDAEE